MLTKINEITAKSILIKTNLPGCDYVINPYNGCQFACIYCYAAQIARWKHQGEQWGSFLDVKINAPEILTKELEKINNKNFGTIFFSSITDPYTGLEAKYQLTRKCLQVLVNFGYQGQVIIQTKSPLVTRDIDLISRLKNVSVGFTVTTLDDKVSRFIEVGAPPVSARIEAIKILTANKIHTYAFIGPILPYFIDRSSQINQLLDTLEQSGITEVWFEHIYFHSKIKSRLFEYLVKESPKLIPWFKKTDNQAYRNQLNQVISTCLKGRNLKLGLGKIIYHRDL